jgi:hypothetical protein
MADYSGYVKIAKSSVGTPRRKSYYFIFHYGADLQENIKNKGD